MKVCLFDGCGDGGSCGSDKEGSCGTDKDTSSEGSGNQGDGSEEDDGGE